MVGYLIGMWVLYCFIMTAEAAGLAAFDRYMITPLIFSSAIGMESLFHVLDRSGERSSVAPAVMFVLSAVLFLFPAKNSVQLVSRPDLSTFERGQVMEVLQDSAVHIPRNSAVALYNGTRGRRDLYYYLTMYEVKSRWVFILDLGNPEYSIPIDTDMLHSYEYLIIAAEEAPLREALINAGFVLRWQAGCTLYRISEDSFGRTVIAPALNCE